MDKMHIYFWMIVMSIGGIAQTVSMYVWDFNALTVAQAITLIILNGGAVFSVIHFSLASNPPKTVKALFSLMIATLVMLVCFAEIYKRTGIIENGTETKDLITCLYFSVVTWTTLGYGDIHPVGWSRLAAAIEALLGYVYLGVFVGLLLKLAIEKAGTVQREKRDTHNKSIQPTPESGAADT